MMPYSPDRHYWLVAGDESRVFSAAARDYVPASDSTYAAWLLAGNLATRIDTEANLWDVLTKQAPQCLPLDLNAYVGEARWRREVGGIILTGIPIATDDRSKLMIVGARANADIDPNFTTQWKVTDGQFVTIDAPTIIAISNAVSAHVAACFAKEAEIAAQIAAGAITTTEEIDAAFATL